MSRYQDYNQQQSFYNQHHHHNQPANDPNNNYYHNYRPSQHNILTEDYKKMVNTNFLSDCPSNAFKAVETRRATTTDGMMSEHKTCYQQKCLCCPYGFHIDLDFLRYLESLRREMHSRSQSPRKVRNVERGKLQLSSAGAERSAFSEDESTFAFGKQTTRERRPDSARADLRGPSYPYVVKPKAEPDVLVAIPDELKTQRSELFLDPEAERKFRASTRLFIDNEPKPLEVDATYDEETSNVELRRNVDSGRAAGDSNRVARPRYRSSVALVIEQLENCLATSQTLVSAPESSRAEKEDEVGQLTKVQVLCSKIISKLRRLHELEEKVRLIPDLDEHILSLTRQLDQLKMKQHRQREEPCEDGPKARSRASTRDVGVGNGVLFPRTGSSTSPTLKKFADISAFSLPPPPPPQQSRKVREVSIQVNTPPDRWQNLNKTSERKLYMNHSSGFDDDMKIGDGESCKGFCCTKCGSTEVAKLESKVADEERGVSNIIDSFNKQTFQLVKLPRESINNSDILDRPKKTPPAVAPKPRVSPKASADPEIDEADKRAEAIDPVKILSKEKSEDPLDHTSIHFQGLLEGFAKENNEELTEVESKTSSRISTFSEKETLSGLEPVLMTSLDDARPSNLFIDNLKTYVLKHNVTITTPTLDAWTPSLTTTVEVFPVEVTTPTIVPVVIDLLESSSESEELEKIDSFIVDEERSKERASSDRKVSKDLVNNESSECLVSEITIEENTDNRSEEIKVNNSVTSDLKILQEKEVDSLKKNSWITSIARKILDEASKYASSFSSPNVSKLPTTVGSHQDDTLKSTDTFLENADPIHTIQTTEMIQTTQTIQPIQTKEIAPSCDNVKPDIVHSSPVSCKTTDQVVKIPPLPASPTSSSSSSSSPSTGSSSLSSSPGFASKSSRTPNAPHSSLVNMEECGRPASNVYLNSMEVENVMTTSNIKRNLFAETLTSDVVLTTTSESSEAENWGELPSSRDSKERNLFADSHGLFLRAAAGKIGALSDPGELWKNKSLSSDFTATSSGDDDDDYCSSSSAAEASAKKAYQLDSKELPAIKEDKTSASSLGSKLAEPKDVGARREVSEECVVVGSETSMAKASTSDDILVSTRSKAKRSQEKVRPCSSGFEMEGVDFMPLDSPSSTITSQSLDAGINEELASIRSPCELRLLRSPVPMIQVIPSSATPTASLGLSSDLSIFEEEDPNVMTTSVERDDDQEDDYRGSPKTGVATAMDEACGISSAKETAKVEDEKTAEEEEDCFLEACVIYANWLTDPTSISDSEKDAIVELIRKDWFLTSGRKMSQGSEVRNALSTMRNFGDLFVENVVNMADGDGNTTLHYAVSHGNGSVVEALLETGLCDGDRQNNAGYTPIMLAALLIEDVNRNFELLKALFESGDVNTASDRSGQTALMLASSHGREEMVTVLLECGADVNIQDEDGSTALMCASEHGHVGIIKALLAHPNCNSSLSDIDGSTALSIAMEEGNHDIGILIYAHMKVHGSVEDEDPKPVL